MLMEESIASNQNDDAEEQFEDAFDEFSFHDCTDAFAGDAGVSSINFDSDHKPSPEISSSPATTLRRRRSLSTRTVADSADSPIPSSSVSFDYNSKFKERKLRFSTKIMENLKKSENLDEIKLRNGSESLIDRVNEEKKELLNEIKLNNSSESLIDRVNEEKKELSTITNEDNERIDDSVGNASNSRENEDTNSNILLFFANLVIKAIGFQINLLIYFITFPIWLIYTSCMFVMDPFGVMRRRKNYVVRKLMRIWCFVSQSVSPFVFEWLKEHKSVWKLGLKCGWGFLWSVYVCVVLVGLLVAAFVMGGLVIRGLVEEPIRIKEPLNFDFTEKSPVAYVPLVACSGADCGEDYMKNVELGKIRGARVIPPNHKLQVTIALTLPESDYNRNLGMFQVRSEFLAANGRILASSRRPCMLQFKSHTIRFLLTFLKVAPLLTGYASESQHLNVKFRGFTEGITPTACLRVIIEQRAEFQPAAGIPEIYTASLTLESELPLLKRIVWYWKKTLFVWISMTIFSMELIFALLCCKPLVIPRVKLRENSASGDARRDNHPVQRSTSA